MKLYMFLVHLWCKEIKIQMRIYISYSSPKTQSRVYSYNLSTKEKKLVKEQEIPLVIILMTTLLKELIVNHMMEDWFLLQLQDIKILN